MALLRLSDFRQSYDIHLFYILIYLRRIYDAMQFFQLEKGEVLLLKEQMSKTGGSLNCQHLDDILQRFQRWSWVSYNAQDSILPKNYSAQNVNRAETHE